MNTILTSLLSYLLLYKYSTLFLVVFSAAIILPLPDSSILLATGAFASQGYFSFAISFAVALVANVLGDIVGYMLTNKFGYHVIKERHIKKFPYFSKVETFVRTQAGPTIIVSRFVGTIGPLVNFLSGLASVPLSKFIFFDLIGNAIDIAAILIIGYALGQYWQDFAGIMDTVGWIFLVLIVVYVTINIYISSRESITSSQ